VDGVDPKERRDADLAFWVATVGVEQLPSVTIGSKHSQVTVERKKKVGLRAIVPSSSEDPLTAVLNPE
jgi:hypothetical protein